MHSYCNVFKAIKRGLTSNIKLIARALKNYIFYNFNSNYKDAKIFFKARGMPKHAL